MLCILLQFITRYQVVGTLLIICTCLLSFQNLFGKEADKLEHANDDERICILLSTVILVGAFDYEATIPSDEAVAQKTCSINSDNGRNGRCLTWLATS